MNKTDVELKQDIEAELRWDPKVNAAQIGVSVDRGAVSLLGAVDTFAQKWSAEAATKRVNGVRTVAQDLTVKPIGEHRRSDSDIASAVQSALTWDVWVPRSVTASVQDHVVTLTGQATWNFEREAAEDAVRHLAGVVNVYNTILVKPDASADSVNAQVLAALHRQANVDANTIKVETSGSKVTLTGTASSWTSIDDARKAAWAAPGVTDVVSRIELSVTH